MSTKFMDLFDAEKRNLAIRLIEYYDGLSKKHLREYLNAFRRNAIQKGMTPHAINITKQIVDKSGMLFSGRAPTLNVYPVGAENVTVDDDASLRLQHLMERAQWVSVFNNLDPVVRLLKSAFLLVQYDAETGEVFFTVLTQANCAVNVVNRKVETLIYYTGMRDSVHTYRIWTEAVVQDLEVTSAGGETVTSVQPNPYGLIPAVPFHDTNIPRDGAWNTFSDDLIDVNFILNLHITDGSYAIQHAKLQTLFTNAVIQGSANPAGSVVEDIGSKLGPRWVTGATGEAFVGGPGEVVAVETTSGESVFLDYKGPSPDIAPLDAAILGWFREYARAWSVSIDTENSGQGAADSGFKLVVKNMPNSELRRQRQRMFEASFQALYRVLLRMNEVFPLGLAPDTVLFVEFGRPELPTDEKVSEETWNVKIDSGRASILDYFCDEKGYTRQEAEEKVLQLAADRALIARAGAPAPQPAPVSGEKA